jgi:hypothetical protein
MSFLQALFPLIHKTEKSPKGVIPMITSLDDDVLSHILSYLDAVDLDYGLTLTCKALR